MATNDCKPLPPLTQDDIRRFWSRVDKSPGQGPNGSCYAWIGGRVQRSGYGRFKASKQEVKAHRIAFFLHHGRDPFPLLVCHSCDWPPCCNWDHLFQGTSGDNAADRDAKGRLPNGDLHFSKTRPSLVPRGERCGCSKLTDLQVLEIRRMHAAGLSGVQILKTGLFAISLSEIYNVVHRRIWTHL